ncbi:MAG: hypothetical protein LBQ03_01860 [Puniceicoccales bacterium]|jgi:hypothetical protein|nr:hypothetical protein [Puniceicoccales bacterium]
MMSIGDVCRDIAGALKGQFGITEAEAAGVKDFDSLQKLLRTHNLELMPGESNLEVRQKMGGDAAVVHRLPLEDRSPSLLLTEIKTRCGTNVPAFLNGATPEDKAKQAKVSAAFMACYSELLNQLEDRGKLGEFLEKVGDPDNRKKPVTIAWEILNGPGALNAPEARGGIERAGGTRKRAEDIGGDGDGGGDPAGGAPDTVGTREEAEDIGGGGDGGGSSDLGVTAGGAPDAAGGGSDLGVTAGGAPGAAGGGSDLGVTAGGAPGAASGVGSSPAAGLGAIGGGGSSGLNATTDFPAWEGPPINIKKLKQKAVDQRLVEIEEKTGLNIDQLIESKIPKGSMFRNRAKKRAKKFIAAMFQSMLQAEPKKDVQEFLDDPEKLKQVVNTAINLSFFSKNHIVRVYNKPPEADDALRSYEIGKFIENPAVLQGLSYMNIILGQSKLNFEEKQKLINMINGVLQKPSEDEKFYLSEDPLEWLAKFLKELQKETRKQEEDSLLKFGFLPKNLLKKFKFPNMNVPQDQVQIPLRKLLEN